MSNVNQQTKKFVKKAEDVYDFLPLLKGKETTRTDAGAIDKSSNICIIKKTSTGAKALTLANGKEGQLLILMMQQYTTSGASVVTPANLNGGTTLSFDTVGETATLLFNNGAWNILSVNGTTIG